ncbi:MAG: hypothetical protein V3V05_07220 [Pontiella sp.]
MKKTILASILLVVCANSFSGLVGLPKEKVALPIVQGSHLVCVWDEAAGNWLSGFENYDHTGVYDFQIPEWGTWYWIGLWDEAAGEYVVGKWIGHFKTD